MHVRSAHLIILFFSHQVRSSDLERCGQWSNTLPIRLELVGVRAALVAKEVHMSTQRHMDDIECIEKRKMLVNVRNFMNNSDGQQKSLPIGFTKHLRYDSMNNL